MTTSENLPIYSVVGLRPSVRDIYIRRKKKEKGVAMDDLKINNEARLNRLLLALSEVSGIPKEILTQTPKRNKNGHQIGRRGPNREAMVRYIGFTIAYERGMGTSTSIARFFGRVGVSPHSIVLNGVDAVRNRWLHTDDYCCEVYNKVLYLIGE